MKTNEDIIKFNTGLIESTVKVIQDGELPREMQLSEENIKIELDKIEKIINEAFDTKEKININSDKSIINAINETIELKRCIDEQKSELELINRELEKRNKELYELSIKDDLTQLYSNNHFTTLLQSEFSRSLKYRIVFSILIRIVGSSGIILFASSRDIEFPSFSLDCFCMTEFDENSAGG